MNQLSKLLVLTTALFLYSCGADIQNNDKIDGRWYLDSTSGGIHGGGFLVEGEVYMEIKGTDIDLYHKDALIMNARFDYKYDDYDNLFIKIDRS